LEYFDQLKLNIILKEFVDETFLERICALTEMFPEPLRDFTSGVAGTTSKMSMGLLKFSKSATWIVASSFTILILPLICEQEITNVQEMQAQQQRQLLLGPSAGMSSPGSPSAF